MLHGYKIDSQKLQIYFVNAVFIKKKNFCVYKSSTTPIDIKQLEKVTACITTVERSHNKIPYLHVFD